LSATPEDDFADDASAPGRPGLPVDVVRITRGLARQWKWFAIVAGVSIVVGVVLAKTVAPKTFTARAVIVWEPGAEQSRQDFGTLIDSMLIPANLNEVKRRLKLGIPLETLAKWIDVFFDPQSDVVSLEGSSGSAKSAKDLADTVIAVFLEHCQNLRRARVEGELQELRANLDVARVTLTTAQEVYDTFRRDNNVTNVSAETSLAIQEAASLRSQAEAARSSAQAEAARARLLEENARHERSMVVTSQSQSDPNSSALAAVQSELIQARARLAPDHPRVAALEAQAAALQGAGSSVQTVSTAGQNTQLAAIKASLAASTTARAAALDLQQTYAEHAAQARERLQKLTAVEGEAAILLSEVTNAASHVTNLEAQIHPLEESLRLIKPEFRVLAPAELPPHASSGKGKLYAAGIPGGSLALLLFVLLGIELRGLRIHTAREASFWANAPTIGTSTWPRIPEALEELVAEVSDSAETATGDTLVIGASPGDERAATELAEALRRRVRTTTTASVPDFETRALIGGVATREDRTTLSEIAPKVAIVSTAAPTQTEPPVTRIHSWERAQKNVTLRRASRLADRVVVVLTSDTLAMPRLTTLRTQLGRDHGIGILLVGIDPALADLPDRVGDVDGFWLTNDYDDEDA